MAQHESQIVGLWRTITKHVRFPPKITALQPINAPRKPKQPPTQLLLLLLQSRSRKQINESLRPGPGRILIDLKGRRSDVIVSSRSVVVVYYLGRVFFVIDSENEVLHECHRFGDCDSGSEVERLFDAQGVEVFHRASRRECFGVGVGGRMMCRGIPAARVKTIEHND